MPTIGQGIILHLLLCLIDPKVAFAEHISLKAEQHFDFDGLRGRLLSSSYVPREGEKAEAMLRELPSLFSTYARDGHVAFHYETKIYYGHLDA